MNILWVLTDQQRADTIRALGNRVIRTPNFRKSRKRGDEDSYARRDRSGRNRGGGDRPRYRLFQAIGLTEFRPLEPVIKNILITHTGPDVSQPIKLSPDLSNFSTEHLVVSDQLILSHGPAAGRRHNGHTIVAPAALLCHRCHRRHGMSRSVSAWHRLTRTTYRRDDAGKFQEGFNG